MISSEIVQVQLMSLNLNEIPYGQLTYARSDSIVKVGCPDETAYLVPKSNSNNQWTKSSSMTVRSFSGKKNRMKVILFH